MLIIKLHAAKVHRNVVGMVRNSTVIKSDDRIDIDALSSSLQDVILNMPLNNVSRPDYGTIFDFLIVFDLMAAEALLFGCASHFNGTFFAKAVVASVA